MNCFRNFNAPVREIFAGNLLLLLCCLFYLAWWIVSFKPNSYGRPAGGGLYITIAFITGIAAIVLLSVGISSLSHDTKGLSVRLILISCAVLFLVLLPITSIVFHRIVTSELILIHIWTALELSAVAVLHNTGRFSAGRTVILAALTGIATVAGLICYVLYYHLDSQTSYYTGMIPLITDAFVVAVFLVMLAV